MKPIFSFFFSFLHFQIFFIFLSPVLNICFFFGLNCFGTPLRPLFSFVFGFAVRTPWQCSRWARGARIFLYFCIFLVFLHFSSFFLMFVHCSSCFFILVLT